MKRLNAFRACSCSLCLFAFVLVGAIGCDSGPGPERDIAKAQELRDKACSCETADSCKQVASELLDYTSAYGRDPEARQRFARGTKADIQRHGKLLREGNACIREQVSGETDLTVDDF